MNSKINAYLFDILRTIEELEGFFKENEITLHILLSKTIITRATERNLEIIGECVKKILAIDPSFPISNARQIIATRNFIAHEYGVISYEIIIEVLNTHLPILKREVHELLKGK
ncbi:uncharacterized protein with HEPN domain [Algoriphagus iocasae]|uniref:Uncharacterized protein with HEPN domain n=1 Tax=Algoriphagus iocasae TaxID=1836499 RepID=A0A841MK72_9BACT|nr:HepT-like ribonuclease domain-containing protein [Algoriphagus iocasae]MBB6328702.1 uncharacterized protein with HEPN domain [Algoriphagus iocasae]